ncbi:hypothetical protein BS614_28800 [Paenibacillus xylanexedens]|uniref:sensor histidine kinase n=1 Tax=Paenibacillus xylanexedens TaxID=528191 RepID=UPI00093877DF|nr:histidine kinase [Paenibacillus xylanexedens]APO47644.1 hypothetical protein BS614_28800 [Paenibacillus xylanexedens]
MKRLRHKGFYNSIFIKLLGIFAILIPVIAMFIYTNYQARSTLVKQVENTHQNMLQSYWIQIDNELNNAVTFAVNTAWFESDLQLTLSNDESDSELAKQRISLNLSKQILYGTNLVDTLFVYTDNAYISASSSQNPEERNAVKSYVMQAAASLETSDLSLKTDWKFIKIYNHSSMIHFSKGDNGVLTGVYVNLDRSLNYYSKNNPNFTLYLIPNNDLQRAISDIPKNNLIITAPSSSAPISFVEVIPEDTILKALPFMQKYTLAISIIVAALLPFLFFLVRLTVVQPLQKLNKAMKHIQRGDLQYRISPYRVSNEIAIVNQTFNQMMDEVQHLKISVYEEEIKLQKSLLRSLQMQIQPHFIINSLNMVYNLLENKDSQTAKKLIVHSVDFYRYMIKVDNDFVPLHEEIKHVDTYLQIQSIRYMDKFTYSLDINKMIADMLVPPMLIQNFVENSIKYSVQSNKCIHIAVNVDYFEIDFYPFAKIIISDTGNGYPINQLELLNQGKIIAGRDGEHIGIRNTVQRLSLLYEGKAHWRFYNDNGAVSELMLPALFPELAEPREGDEE